MQLKGNIRKLKAVLHKPVSYWLPIGDEEIFLNDYIGKKLILKYNGKINCINCGRASKKSFSQGHCYPCFMSLASCDTCIMRPHLCHYSKGTCREPQWGLKNCMQEHYVYLANSSSAKVGITRGSQIPTRWIDQGASFALPILKVKNRYHSGLAEIIISEFTADKTNWRKMLKNEIEDIDLFALKEDILSKIDKKLATLRDEHDNDSFEVVEQDLIEIDYPVQKYPSKITSVGFDKMPVIEGVLVGIKGQYLIFEDKVLNIRKHTGYELEVEFD